ncbi:uncharacterized protein LOC107013581 [Solanum pennellii]|uniref:Uncharacterized protein LOC107013581 n=1 Tax=Solanum pennellii TaxID=28526 RepID=A0ABM1GBZ2_SOLPN|nr:uncharacterized protein LOC107013581 [Solanum pennellii]
MVKRYKQIIDIVAVQMGEMRALMERLFGELNVKLDKSDARLKKFDEQILELKKCIGSFMDQEKGKKMIQVAINPSSNGHENSSMLQEKQVKRHREPILATYSRKRNKKKDVVSMTKDASVDAPILGLVPTKEIEIDLNNNANVPIVDFVNKEKTEIDMELSMGSEFCVTGYHRELPLAVLMGEEETTHNFINESLADKLGCETVSIHPQTVRSDLGEMVTSRLCNNFHLSMEGIVFNLKLYLLPLSSKYDIVLGGEWLGALEKITISSDGIELYLLEGGKKFMPFKKSVRGRRRRRF